MLRFMTAGESHGQCLIAILDGMVAGLGVSPREMDRQLWRRQQGYGRGGRMSIEKDRVEILSGVRFGRTIGAPIALRIKNKDFKIDRLGEVKKPRPGHADLVGAMKYDRHDARDILERSSARETAARVAVGALCKSFLAEFGVEMISHVVCLGGVKAQTGSLTFRRIRDNAYASPVACADATAAKRMMARIDQAKKAGDTLGGIFELVVQGLPPGLGSYAQFDRRLSAQLGAAVLSVQSIKGVEMGMGFEYSGIGGLSAHDEIFYDRRRGFFRKTNRAGGLEGGMTTGQPLVIRAVAKPIPTVMSPLRTVHLDRKTPEKAVTERSDVTVVPAAGVVAEAMVAFELAKSFLEKFGGDSLKETLNSYRSYLKQLRRF